MLFIYQYEKVMKLWNLIINFIIYPDIVGLFWVMCPTCDVWYQKVYIKAFEFVRKQKEDKLE